MAAEREVATRRTEGTNLPRSPFFKGVRIRPVISPAQGNALSATIPYRASGLRVGSASFLRKAKLVSPSFQLPGQLCLAQTINPSAEKHRVPVTKTLCNQPLY
ncbi:hypothetical protein PPTG_23232 [Phytophthora nicotianae INRA-310]|uniref:Uncharacterized protein n=1 Tax=Phytophthora nicotianae (strain INRA-310) TaxID=761204 RepID=W2Q2P3_PHYN3|nr:hypothetical protein PPTG_23232 [Phytophthora nicotianae INRA-310]ETN07151.1 hypothetical protein PPTG_23232 [Phytophthora nicotianae INRA-310]